MRRVFGSFKWLPRIATVVPERDRSFGAILSVSYDFHLGNGDNGNVYKIINGRDGNRTQNFTYDALNRIAEAWTSGANWGERFTIDPWGNLTRIAILQLLSGIFPRKLLRSLTGVVTGYGS